MKNTLQLGGNAVLMRELRASLRNARPFALVAIYVAVLGAIVVANFPANQEIQITTQSGGSSTRGKDLYWTFVLAQALLIFVVLPAIASGALSQEREQRTLEPLLLTPLTPLQIVWGKAVGVLSLAGLLLVSTLPLTSLCFLLGGVSPGELVAAYIVLIGLALFAASIGIYCSAKWTNTIHATLMCYVLLPLGLMFLSLFIGLGVVVAALAMFGYVFYSASRLWKRWGEHPVGSIPLRNRIGLFWSAMGWLAMMAIVIVLLRIMLVDKDIGPITFGGLVITYLIFVAQMALQQAAREIVRPQEPTAPARQRMHDLKADWHEAMAMPAPYLPDSSPLGSPQPQDYPAAPPAPRPPEKETYGKAPFLSDKLNPIYAKDLRSGLLGKFEYLLRFSYIAVIGSQLLLIFLALAMPAQSLADEWSWFSTWANAHLVILLVAGAWLGARSIAPEHEQQTLPQLIATPMTPSQIVSGKVQAVMTYTFYIFMLGLPLSILLAAVRVVTWRAALSFIVIELVFGALAAAWGMYCSLKGVTTRRALAVSLGGVFCLILSAMLFDQIVMSGFKILTGQTLLSPEDAFTLGALLSPLRLLSYVLLNATIGVTPTIAGASSSSGFTPSPLVLPLSLLIWSASTLLLLFFTTRGFQKYADTI